MTKDLVLQDTNQLEDFQKLLCPLTSFVNPIPLLENLEKEGYTPSFAITEVVKLAKQDENLTIKLKAIRFLHQLVTEALQAAGLLVHAARTVKTEGGDTLTLSAELVAASLPKPQNPKGEPENETEKQNPKLSKPTGIHKPPKAEWQNLFPGISATEPPEDPSDGDTGREADN